MGIELYSCPPSAPARTVLLFAKQLDIPMEIKNLDLIEKKEHLKPEFVAINPQHTIPTLVDDGFVVTESRAIIMYLQNKYGKNENLYPIDPQKRAVVDMRLFFDVSTLYLRFGEAHYPVIFQKQKPDPKKMARIDEALGWVELFLKDGYIAGSELTIADFTFGSTLSTIQACDFDLSKFPKVVEYLKKLRKEIKGWDEANQVGADVFGEFYRGRLAAIDDKRETLSY